MAEDDEHEDSLTAHKIGTASRLAVRLLAATPQKRLAEGVFAYASQAAHSTLCTHLSNDALPLFRGEHSH